MFRSIINAFLYILRPILSLSRIYYITFVLGTSYLLYTRNWSEVHTGFGSIGTVRC